MNESRTHDRDRLLKEHTEAIGMRIKDLRIAKGYDQLDLAFYSMISVKTIYTIEAGCDNLTLKTLVNLADALEVKIVDLL